VALNNLGLGFVLTARDLASRGLGKVNRSFNKLDADTARGSKRMQASLAAAGKAMGALVAGGVLVGGSFALANKAGEFEQGLAKVGAISRATAADMETLEKAAAKAGLTTQFSPKEATEGLAELAAQGFNATEATKALTPALDLAAGGQISVAESTEAMAAAVKVFGLDLDKSGLAADKLLTISNSTALKSKDLALALGTVGRGAIAAGQSIDEILPSIGLVKNTGVEASVAASSVSSALLFMGKNSKAFKQIGVDVTDAQGKFKPFLDVVLETQAKLGGLADDKKTEKLIKLFGRFGITAFSATTAQLGKGIKNAKGEIVKGADAVAFLRGEMEGAKGTAKEFKRRLLDNFAGAKQIFKGVADTAIIEFGKPFKDLLKGVVRAASAFLNILIRVLQAIPAPIKKFLAGLVLAAGGLLLVVGGIALAKVAIGALMAILPAVIAALGAMIVAAAPFIAIAAAIAAGIAAIAIAYKRNLGGFADLINDGIGKIRLFWNGLQQVINTGGFSGAVMKELNKAENAGIKGFIVTLFRLWHRVKAVWKGIKAGFEDFVMPIWNDVKAGIGDAVGAIREAFTEVGKALGSANGAFGKVLGKSDGFRSLGEVVGKAIGAILTPMLLLIQAFALVVTGAARFTAFLVRAVREPGKVWRQTVAFFREAVDFIGEKISGMFKMVGATAKAIAEPVVRVFQRIADGIQRALSRVKDFIIRTIRQIPDWALPERLEKFAQQQTSEERAASIVDSAGAAATAAASARPAVEQAYAASRGVSAGLRDGAGSVGDMQAMVEAIIARQASRPIVLKVDGERIAEAVQQGRASGAARGFQTVTVI